MILRRSAGIVIFFVLGYSSQVVLARGHLAGQAELAQVHQARLVAELQTLEPGLVIDPENDSWRYIPTRDGEPATTCSEAGQMTSLPVSLRSNLSEFTRRLCPDATAGGASGPILFGGVGQ